MDLKTDKNGEIRLGCLKGVRQVLAECQTLKISKMWDLDQLGKANYPRYLKIC